MLKRTLLSLVLVTSLGVSASESTTHSVPNPTEQEVHSIFGERLSQGSRPENLLLLAIAMDQQSRESPTRDEKIGIPYISSAGAGYWVRLFQQEKDAPSLDTLVNNALILIYAKDQAIADPVREKAALRLLSVAAELNYWPAQVYVSERRLAAWRQGVTPMPMKREKAEAEKGQVVEYLESCMRIGFAPCQFQLGFWYIQEPASQKMGMNLLEAGVEVVRRDKRYTTSAETMNDLHKSLAILVERLGVRTFLSPDERHRFTEQTHKDISAVRGRESLHVTY